MTELKTLKELQCDLEWKFDTFVALRQEAIKWVKEWLWSLDEDCNPDSDKETITFMNKSVYSWIKHFFNITEEELK